MNAGICVVDLATMQYWWKSDLSLIPAFTLKNVICLSSSVNMYYYFETFVWNPTAFALLLYFNMWAKDAGQSFGIFTCNIPCDILIG